MNREKVSIDYKLIKELIEVSNYLAKELESAVIEGFDFGTAKLMGKHEFIVNEIDEAINEQVANQILGFERHDI